ncbi:MAG TPA: hypothetical protein VEL07_08380 [Planctomycetota bacterium]|nr:hypothetical protein [Planctomycetota bacterium]
MGWVILVVLSLICAVLQHSWLAQWPLAPDLPLALLAWMVVDGSDDGVLIRAFVVGLVRDCVDPASVCFHTFAYFVLALAFLPARPLVFRTRTVGWAAFAALATVLLLSLDRLTGGGDATVVVVLAIAILTAASTWPLGWPWRFVPGSMHPAGKGGA